MRQKLEGITETHKISECSCFEFLSLPKMHTLKEKFIPTISSLFPQYPKSSTTQASPCSKKGKSLSSYWSNIFPSVPFIGSKTSNDKSVSVASNCENFNQNGDSSSMSNRKDLLNDKSDDKDEASRKSSSNSEAFEEVYEQHSPTTPIKPLPNFTDHSTFISHELNQFFELCLPNATKGCQRVLLYSTLKHGISLRTLLRNSAKLSGPGLLIAGDTQGAVFGGLVDCPMLPTAKRKYQGTNQAFVFTTVYGQPRLFRPTGVNRYYYLCLYDLVAFGGGGGSPALCLDEDLLNGSSGPCDTFGNMCLAHTSEFELKNVELWGFTYTSPYLIQD